MKCLIAGATGLVGKEVIQILTRNDEVDSITSVTRSPVSNAKGKIENLVVSFERLSQTQLPSADVAFCCLGTTLGKAGSQEAFFKVDHDYVIEFAKACLKSEVKAFVVVSSLGADSKSGIFYNRVKGQVEDDLAKLGFKNLVILRPALLLGERSERRTFERWAQIVSPALNLALIGPLKKYRAVKATDVAKKMVEVATQNFASSSVRVISNEQIF